ncbi:MAG: DUF2867 domain-containing protein [Bacteroidota bacterium]|nr:DUF2867 domain-containing protein [Bacteroidota bacterium]
MKTEKITVPKTPLLDNALPKIDYSDTFACKFICGEPLVVDDFVKGFFSSAPKWVEALFMARNKIVRLAGLKAPNQQDKIAELAAFKIEKGGRLGLFKIFDRSLNEVLMGEDDKHLDFRVSFLLERVSPAKEIIAGGDNKQNRYSLTVTTLVSFKNIWGKIYFLPVKPMHKIVVNEMIRSIVKDLKNKKVVA